VMLSKKSEVLLGLMRNNKYITVTVKPQITETQDSLGNKEKVPMLGIKAGNISLVRLNFAQSIQSALYQCYSMSKITLIALKQMLLGQRSVKELGGPIKIAKYSGQVASQAGTAGILLFVAMLSVNLGLFNLLPIPVLDGGHAVNHIYEILTGSKILHSVYMALLYIGGVLLLTLMSFAIVNDVFNVLLYAN
jgi:regulator of sigma E protease